VKAGIHFEPGTHGHITMYPSPAVEDDV